MFPKKRGPKPPGNPVKSGFRDKYVAVGYSANTF